MVGTVKNTLKKIAQQRSFSWDDFTTLMCTVESIVNRRPLATCQDSVVGEVLTPMHFLLGAVPPPLIHPSVSTDEEVWTLTRRWRHRQAVADHFWRQWTASYLPELRRWRRSLEETRSPAVGEVVLVEETSGPRSRWPLGRVSRLLPGPDGVVRAVEIEIRGHVTRRPVQRLIPLEVDHHAETLRDAAGGEPVISAEREPPEESARGFGRHATGEVEFRDESPPPAQKSTSRGRMTKPKRVADFLYY
jgi:hypothetical protein